MFSRRARNYILFALALSLGAIALSVIVWFFHLVSHPQSALALSDLEFTPSILSTPPGNNEIWHPLSLPDDWYHSQRKDSNGWYRYAFELKVAPNRLWAVYLPTVQQNAAIYLNGELLGNGGSFEEPVSRNWNRPLYFNITNGLLKPGENVLHIRLKAIPSYTGLLSEVFLGSDQDLRPIYKLRYFFRYTLTQFIVLVLVLTSILMFILWWHRRQESVYIWFSIGIMEWAIHNLNLIIIDIPFSTHLWDRLTFITLLWFPIVITSFVQRFIGIVNYQVERWSYLLASLLGIILLILPVELSNWVGMRITDPMALGFGLYPVYRLLKYAWKTPEEEVFLMMFSGMVLVVFGLHDLLIVNYLISRVDGFFMQYSAPAGLLIFAYILLKRFVKAVNESENLNRSLESQIAVKHHELELSYQKMQKLENHRVLAEERERLMRDMHDGMGGHIISTLALLDNNVNCDINSNVNNNKVIRIALQSALDDLRLMIDSMEDVNGDVLTILGMLRQRLEPRLNQAGIQIEWRVKEVPTLKGLGPEKSLHLLRIFQEAITNVLKHSAATRIIFETQMTKNKAGEPGIKIECRDNGKGLPKNTTSENSGRGKNNIKRRAISLGGLAGIDSSEQGGVNVWLWIPL